MHSTIRNNLVILTQEVIYRTSSLGKLEEIKLCENVISPLQERFYSDSKACFPIAIDYLPAFAFEQGIVGTAMPISQSTAMAAPFGSVPTINNVQYNSFVKASAFKQDSEFIEGNAHNFSVEVFALWAEPFKVLNSNISIIPQSHFSYLLNNFSEPILDEVLLSSFEPFETSNCSATSFIREALNNCPSAECSLALVPNILSKIGLFKNFAFWRDYRNSEAFGIYIHPKNIFSLRQFGFLFREIGNNLLARSQSKGFALPSFADEVLESLEVPVFFDWNWNLLSFGDMKFDKESIYRIECFTNIRNIKFDSNCFGFAFSQECLPFNIAYGLRKQRGVSLAS